MSQPFSQTPDTSVNGVQVWTVHLDSLSPRQLEELSGVLDPAEQTRAARFHFEHDRRHYLASRGLLRQVLGTALDKPASTLAFEYGAQGKPALAAEFMQERILRFNLSHSTGWAMFALAWDRELGVDLESGARLERDAHGLSGLAGRVLSARELSIWEALPEAEREAAFLRAWTRKEACAKATGKGLFDEVNRLEVALDAAAPKSPLTLPPSPREGERRDEVGSCMIYRPPLGSPPLSRSSRNSDRMGGEPRQPFGLLLSLAGVAAAPCERRLGLPSS